MRQPRPPVRDGAPLRLAPAPLLGADTGKVLAEAGADGRGHRGPAGGGDCAVIRSVAVYLSRLCFPRSRAADAPWAGSAAADVTLVYGGGGQGMMRRVADAALEVGAP